MIIINKSNKSKYSSIAHRALSPGQRSADIDAAGLRKALNDVLKSCGNTCCVRLNGEESMLIARLMELDSEGSVFKCEKKTKTQLQILMDKEMVEKKAKIASIKAAQAKEAAIHNETTYASRRDIDSAKAKSMSIKGDVEAKKLDRDVTGTVSLKELMSDNKFIEESMKHSNVKTVVAGSEGWDLDKIKESNEKKEQTEVNETSDTQGTQPEDVQTSDEKPSKRRRRSSK